MTLRLECAFEIGKISALDMWRLLVAARPDVLWPGLTCDVYGSTYAVRDIAKKLSTERKQFLTAEAKNFHIHFSPLGAHAISLLQIGKCIASESDASRWMDALVCLPSFVQGRLFDEEYDFWQNARDPLEYQSRNRSFDHLPLRSNGLPPPLDQLEIDTSGNPGLRQLRVGLIESVGSPMWISTRLFEQLKLLEEDIEGQQWLNAERHACGVWKLSVQDSVFTTAEGDEGKLQRRLRDFLFQFSAEA